MKRITPAFVTLMMLVVVGLLIGVYIVKGLWAKEDGPDLPDIQYIPMAASDLEPGTLVTESNLGQAPVDPAQMTPDTLISNRVIVGRVVKERIKAAQPIRSSQLYPPGQRPPLKVPGEMRAVTVAMGSSGSVVDGLIQPGQYVDVHLTPTLNTDDPRLGGGTTMTLFKGVKVLAMNQSLQASSVDRGGNTVTLELTPEQANIVILADSAGELTMSYNPSGKGEGGVTISNADRATLEEILSLEALPDAGPFHTEQFRGSGRAVNTYRNGTLINHDASSNSDARNPRRPVSNQGNTGSR